MKIWPERIVCLTEETTETLYLIEEDARIVGISGFTVRPARARKEKPKVSAFTSAKIDKIMELKPDLVLGFSDLQADIAKQLIERGVEVHVFNHRSIDQILGMIASLSAMVGAADKGMALVEKLSQDLQAMWARTEQYSRRPCVYFEEWDDPMFSGIQWVSELVNVAGGDDCFAELSTKSLGKDRIIADPEEVIRRQPDIIIGSWCGKKFRPERVAARDGWEKIPAVRDEQIFEIKSAYILQPGPAALTDGLAHLDQIISDWIAFKSASEN